MLTPFKRCGIQQLFFFLLNFIVKSILFFLSPSKSQGGSSFPATSENKTNNSNTFLFFFLSSLTFFLSFILLYLSPPSLPPAYSIYFYSWNRSLLFIMPQTTQRLLLLLLAILLYLSAVSIAAADSSLKCNGYEELCSRSYNDITYMTTHASFAVTSKDTPGKPGTQYHDIKQQLADGVRGFHLTIQQGPTTSDVRMCYLDCSVNDGGDLQNALVDIKKWMDANKNDVVTVFLESVGADAAPAAVLDSFVKSGIDDYAYAPSPAIPADWPSLETMIKSDKRLVVFVESSAISGGNPKGYFIPYDGVVKKTDGPFNHGDGWTCGPYGGYKGTIMLLPHYIIQTATYKGVKYTNMPYPFGLGSMNGFQFEFHAAACRSAQSIWVNFPMVDFYDEGHVKTSTQKFNALPYKGDDSSNFYPEFYKDTAPGFNTGDGGVSARSVNNLWLLAMLCISTLALGGL